MERLMNHSFKPFYFLRHGETDWNLNHIAMGMMDVPLNERGLSQAHSIANDLKEFDFQTIISSPLIRAKTTAQIIADKTEKPLIIIETLAEACWGNMEGQPKGNGEWIESWRKGDALKNAESFDDFQRRVKGGLEMAFAFPAPVLIVSHGGVYWAIQKILGMPFLDIHNCQAVFHQPPEQAGQPWSISLDTN